MLQNFLRSLLLESDKDFMQLLHQTISKLKDFEERSDTLNLHGSQLVLG